MGFTAFDSETEPILDPSIGEIEFRRKGWSKTSDSFNEVIKSHQCSDQELGIIDSSPKYMKPRQDSFEYVKVYRKKFRCIDEKDRFISGNFNTVNA